MQYVYKASVRILIYKTEGKSQIHVHNIDIDRSNIST